MNISKIIKVLIMISISTSANSKDGVWRGVFDINGNGNYDFIGLISNNKATAYTEKAKVIYDGNIKTEGNKFIWNLKMYLKDGTSFGTAEITGEILNNNTMSGKWTTEPAKDYGNIYLVKLKDNKVVDTGKIINRNWISKNKKNKINISINENKISGKDKNNCNYYGQIKRINKKIYFAGIEIASCGVSDGIYTGMAHIRKVNNKNNLIINTVNKNFSFFLSLY